MKALAVFGILKFSFPTLHLLFLSPSQKPAVVDAAPSMSPAKLAAA
jgi:hypothetical protein